MRQYGSERIVSLDYVKAMSIFLVLLSHTAIPVGLSVWINEFHVPLFFFISGCLFSFSRNPRTVTFIKKRARQLLVPFVWMDIVSYVFWLMAGRHYGSDAGLSVPWYGPLVSSLYGDTGGMVHNLPLWFFLSLFLVCSCCYGLLSWLRARCVSKNRFYYSCSLFFMLPLLFLAAGWAVYVFCGNIPFLIGQSLVMAAFYMLGYVCRRLTVCQTKRNGDCIWPLSAVKKRSLALLLVSGGAAALLITLGGTVLNDKVAVYDNYYGSYPLFVIFAISGIFLMLVVGYMMGRTFGEMRPVRMISDNTLLICGLHLMIFSVLKGISHYVLGISMEVFSGAIQPNLLLSLAAIALCLPVAAVIRRYFPWMIGVGKKRSGGR